MDIDLTTLFTNKENTININEKVQINEDLLKNTNIRNIKNTKFIGSILKNNEIFTILGNLQGTMVLPDDITLEDVNYDFFINVEESFSEFEENFENNLKIIDNSLDIFPFLWQNILLEIPSKVRGTSKNQKLSGDNWKVITEDELETTNRSLSDLKELLNKRKE